MSKKEIKVTSRLSIWSWDEISKETQELITAARKATERAYAPHSNFMVGAAVLLQNGLTYAGSNQENIAYPSGLCAERVACFAAKSTHPDIAIQQIALVARPRDKKEFQLATPCGSCRQVMSEYETQQQQPIALFLVDGDTIYRSDSIKNILPFQFSF